MWELRNWQDKKNKKRLTNPEELEPLENLFVKVDSQKKKMKSKKTQKIQLLELDWSMHVACDKR